MTIEKQPIGSMSEANGVLAKFLGLGTAEAAVTRHTQGETSVITLNEIGGTFGYGFGGGKNGENEEGGGGGGGGMTWSRPVATILITPNGVRLEPVVDVTKIAVTMFTTLGAIFMVVRRMRRTRRELRS
ncbi:MAG: spore germination protein GerW family protein [Chloroflexi bacterium]|nr:spore germination protein GerW family protein [Chloroflexota bacterium]